MSECSGAKVRTCQADSHGCRSWSTATACSNGFCADATTCGTCQATCAPASSCAWQAGSCAEVVRRETEQIGNLASTSDGLFWNRGALTAGSALVGLSPGPAAPVVLGTDPNEEIHTLPRADVLYAVGNVWVWSKPSGQPVTGFANYLKKQAIFANATTVYFGEGASSFTTLRRITRRGFPATCVNPPCGLTAETDFYVGDGEWPGSSEGAGSDTELFFVSQHYGNFPVNDVKRDDSRILRQSFTAGAATVLRHFSGDKYGPSKLRFRDGWLYYLRDDVLARINVTDGAEQVLHSAPFGGPKPFFFDTDGHDVFWLDSHGQLIRLREGAAVPEVLAQGASLGVPYNLTVTPSAVYFTGDSKTALLRWKR